MLRTGGKNVLVAVIGLTLGPGEVLILSEEQVV